MTSLLQEIQEKAKGFSKSQRRIASYIQEHYEQAAFMTASKLGEAAGVSESTVVRFAYALDLDGYPALQSRMEEMVLGKLTSVQRARLAEDIPENDVLRTVLNNDISSLRQTLEMASPETFARAVDTIIGARKIGVLGLRSALPLAQFLSYYLGFICGNVVNFTGNPETLKEEILRLDRQDVMVCLSFPRYSAKTVEAIRFARDRGVTIVALTDKLDSPIGRMADTVLLAKSDMASFADSLTAPLSVINAIITSVGQKSRPELRQHLQTLEDMWGSDNVYLTDGGSL